MKKFVAEYSNLFDNVNRDIINIRREDDMLMYLEECCRELENSLPDNIKYLTYTKDSSRKSFRTTARGENKKKGATSNDNYEYVNVDYTHAIKYIFKFSVKYEDSKTIATLPIYVPQLDDQTQTFIIRGKRYSAPFQLIDSVVYAGKKDSIVMKTLTRAIKMSRSRSTILDVHGQKYKTHAFYLHMKSKRIPFLLFYFASFGFFKTLRFFGVEDDIGFYSEIPIEPDKNLIFFKLGSMNMGVNRRLFQTNHAFREFVSSILDLNRRSINISNIQSVMFWENTLGYASGSTNNTRVKAQELLVTFRTALDKRTMDNIQKLMNTSLKRNTFAVVRWMFLNYSMLLNRTTSLDNKRLRLSEYLVVPFVRDMLQRLYRYLSMSTKRKDIDKLLDIFKISPTIIIDAIIGKTKKGGLNIAKFSDYVNDMTLFNVITKVTIAGPGSPVEGGGKMIPNSMREFDQSFMGRIDLVTTPNGDPGITRSIVPSADIDPELMIFRKT